MKKSRIGDYGPTHYKAFTSFASDIDLTAQSGMPKWEAERLYVYNGTGAVANLVIAMTLAGADVSIPIPGGAAADDGWSETLDLPVQKIDTTTGTLTVVAFWWHDGDPTHLNA